MRAWLVAALDCGILISNKSRTGFRCLYGPDQPFALADPATYVSEPISFNLLLMCMCAAVARAKGKSKHLDVAFEHTSKEGWYKRLAQVGCFFAVYLKLLSLGLALMRHTTVRCMGTRQLWDRPQGPRWFHPVSRQLKVRRRTTTQVPMSLTSAVDPEHQHKGSFSLATAARPQGSSLGYGRHRKRPSRLDRVHGQRHGSACRFLHGAAQCKPPISPTSGHEHSVTDCIASMC